MSCRPRRERWLSVVLLASLLLAGCDSAEVETTMVGPAASLPLSASEDVFLKGSVRLGSEIPSQGQVQLEALDGTLLAEGELDASGFYSLRSRSATVPEYRAQVQLEDGTVLSGQAEAGEAFLAIDELSSVLARFRLSHPEISESDAETLLRIRFNIPSNVAIDSVGDDVSPFSEDLFVQALEAAGNANNFLDEQASLLTAGATSEFVALQPSWAYSGIQGWGRDPEGGSDPDLTVGSLELAQEPVSVWNPSSFKFGSSAMASVGSTLKDAKALKDLFGSKSATGRLLTFAGVAGTAINYGLAIYDIYTQAEDPQKVALADLDLKIGALNSKLEQIAGFQDWRLLDKSLSSIIPALDGEAQDLRLASNVVPQVYRDVQYTPDSILEFLRRLQNRNVRDKIVTVLQGLRQGRDGAVSLYYQLLMLRIGAPANRNGDDYKLFNNYSFRNNDLTLQARQVLYKYIALLDRAMMYDANEANVAYSLGVVSPSLDANFARARSLGGAVGDSNLQVIASEESYSFQRRLALQQAVPRFSSDEIAVCPKQQLIWSLKDSVRLSFGNFKTADGFFPFRLPTYDFSVVDIYPKWMKGFRVDENFREELYWRVPSREEIKTLPGYASGHGAYDSLTLGGFDIGKVDVLICEDLAGKNYDDNDGNVQFFNVSFGQWLRLINLETGTTYNADQVKTDWNIGLLRVCSFDQMAKSMPELFYKGDPKAALFPNLNANALASIPNFPDLDKKNLYYSPFYLQAGIQPWRIYTSSSKVLSPSKSIGGRSYDPSSVTALSALGVWRFTTPGYKEPAYVLYDLSGYVAWKSSKPGTAVVLNNANYRPNLKYEKTKDDFVSPYYAPVLWTKPEPFQATAVWAQGVEDPSGLTCDVQPTVSVSDQNPAYLRSFTISPGRLAYTRPPAGPIHFFATGGYTNREQRDLSRECDWYAYLASSSDPTDVGGPLPSKYGVIGRTGSLQLTSEAIGKTLVVSISAVHQGSGESDVTEVLLDY